MVFEELLTRAVKRKIYSLILGILYVFIGYGTAKIFFPDSISLAMMILTTLLFVPSLSKLLSMEEKIERREGIKHFFRNHKTLMEIFLFLFIGIFIGYLFVGNFFPDSITEQKTLLEKQNAYNIQGIDDINKNMQFTGIISNNIELILIAFVLSLFYGAGALFLLVRTAGFFASFVIGLSNIILKQTSIVAAALSAHFIPEIFGFILAAFAGGVLSKAVVREKFGSTAFRNVVKDGSILFLLSILMIILAALIEVYLTPGLVLALI